jgi:DNA-binding HxlR family transcriptional regulator
MTRKSTSARRSDCPLNVCLEIFGDKWSLLIVRDLLFHEQHEFKDYLAAKEGIATNVLTDRLRRLEQNGIITRAAHAADRRRVEYRLSEKGLDLLPLLMEMAVWATKHEKTSAPEDLMQRVLHDRETLISELKERHRG